MAEEQRQISQETFLDQDRYRIQSYYCFQKGTTPSLALLICHGYLASFKGTRAEEIAEEAEKRGYLGAGFDFEGHGNSEGPRGSFTKDSLGSNIFEQYNRLREQFPSIEKIILCGNSLTSFGALEFASQSPELLDSLILISPYTKLENVMNGLPELQKKFLEAVHEIYQANPHLEMGVAWKQFKDMGLNQVYEGIKEFNLEDYAAQPIVVPFQPDKNKETRFIPISVLDELKHMDSFEAAQGINVPTLILAGTDDRVIGYENILDLYKFMRDSGKEVSFAEFSDNHFLTSLWKNSIKKIFDFIKKRE